MNVHLLASPSITLICLLSVPVKISSSFTQFSTGESKEFRDLSEDWLTPKNTKARPRHDFKVSRSSHRLRVTRDFLKPAGLLPRGGGGSVTKTKTTKQDFEVFKKSLKHRILLKSKFFCHCLLGAA